MNPTVDISRDRVRIDDLAPRAAWLALVVGAAGLGAALLLGAGSWPWFFRAYVMNYTFAVGLALGALFFVLIHHLTRAGWSVAVRRLAEHITAAFPVLALLSLPILIPLWLKIGPALEVFEWANPDKVAHDEILKAKAAYLNVPFFTLRIAIYFGVWAMLSNFFRSNSLRQDDNGDPAITARMQGVAAPGMLLFALTTTFFAVDMLMSLNPHWFSTIFGVYYFSGSTLGFFGLLAFCMALLQSQGRLSEAITVEHYHDVGKLLFAFTVFWAYIAFSQYMLIWYANLPEETFYFSVRQQGPWLALSFILLFGKFVFPFLLIISRRIKRRPGQLMIAALWMLLMQWLDCAYLALPYVQSWNLDDTVTAGPLETWTVIQALLCGVGVLGLFSWSILSRVGSSSLVPLRDPRLGESLAFENI